MNDVMILLQAALTARTLNLLFAGVCVCAACGLGARWVAVLSALLYLGLAFC